MAVPAADAQLEFRILGPLEVHTGGRPVQLTRAKQRALLLALLLRANETVSTDALIEALWGERPPATATVALQGHVSALRKLLPPDALLTRPPGYLLQLNGAAFDLARFEELRHRAREAADPATAVAALREALGLWRGPLPSDLADDSVLQAEIGRLEELRVAAVEERIDAELSLGLHAELVAELEALVRTSPFRERLRTQLMLALYRSGRQADALDVYQAGRSLLLEELGIDPGPALQQLHQQILRQDAALLAPAAEPERDLLVGRDGELRELRAAFDDAASGRGRVVLLAGSAGIGKTRLAEEAAAYGAARGAAALWGHSYEDESPPPYWLWEQILRGLGVETVFAAGSEHDRFRLFDDLSSTLHDAARSTPLVLVLEDLHWADPASLLALQFVARTIRGSRVLIVGTYRDEDLGRTHPFAPVLGQLRRERLCELVQLRGLDADGVGALVRAAAADESLAQVLHEETGGNPFFVQELLRNLDETGELDIPDSVRDVVARRLARLSGECGRLLTAAAILGTFSEAVAARMLEVDRPALLAALDEAVGAGVLVESGFGRHAFSHALLRETLAGGLDTVTRVDLHRRAGEAIEAVYGDDLDPHLGELAHHFAEAARAGGVRKAIDYCGRAAERATAQLAYEQGAALLARALQLLELEENVSRRERCDLLLTLGDAYWRSGSFRKARRTFRDGAELARALGDWNALARSAIGYAGGAGFDITVRNDFLTELFADAIAALPPGHELMRARLQARLAQALIAYPERGEESEQLVADALRHAQGDDATLAYVITSAYLARWSPEDAEERVAMATELVELGTRLRNDGHRLNGLSWRIPAHLEVGDIEGVDTDLREWEQIFERRPVPYARWGLLLLQAMRALLRGETAEGRRLAELAVESGQADDNPNALQIFAIQSIGLARAEGVTDELVQLAVATLEQYPNVVGWRAIVSAFHAWRGDEESARRELSRIADAGFENVPRDLIWTSAVAFSAETAALLGDTEAAASLYPLLTPAADLHVVLGWALYDGSMARRLALLAATLGRWDEADAHYARALAAERRLGAHAALAQTERDYAAVRARLGHP
jgi:DNA-binding SARP family transcriptional activator